MTCGGGAAGRRSAASGATYLWRCLYSRHGASCPLRAAVRGIALQSPIDHLGDLVILIGAGPPWPDLVVQVLQAEISVTLSPLTHGHARQAHPLGNGCVGSTGSASQHDLSPLHDRMGQRP